MPYDKDNPPSVAKSWSPEDQAKCVAAANAVLSADGDDDQAVFACIHAAGHSKVAKGRANALVDGWKKSMEALELMRELGIEAIYDGVVMPAKAFFKDKEKDKLKTYSHDAEIFAAGKWNGLEFTVQDLRDIAANFTALEPYHKVPLKFGHNSEQSLTDGQPALGWVTKVWVADDGKLMGRFEDVPKIVADAMRAKLYRKVSIELDIDVEHKGKKYNYVLSGVALLGADIPAVSTLADLSTYMSGVALTASRRAEFSAITVGEEKQEKQQQQQETEMEQKEIEALVNSKVQPILDQNKILSYDNSKLKLELEAMREQGDKQQQEEKKQKIKLARESVNKLFDDAVKQGIITPAKRENYIKTFKVNDDEAVTVLNLDELRDLIGMSKERSDFGRDKSLGNGNGGRRNLGDGELRVHDDAGEEIDRLTKIELSRMTNGTYIAAKEIVLTRNPELGREYISPGEEA